MPDDFDPDAAQERLDDLGDDISRARDRAEDDVEPGDGERTFADSGATEEDDDQTIVPPG
ncbi:MAG: hypothetical protein H0U89_00565 [Acidimicrobiia bacterium]|nr:hypothetical protein [Acidimicrobiia bacterium]